MKRLPALLAFLLALGACCDTGGGPMCPDAGSTCDEIADCAAGADCRQVSCSSHDGCPGTCSYTLTFCAGSTCGGQGCGENAPCTQPIDPSVVSVCVNHGCVLAPADDPGQCGPVTP